MLDQARKKSNRRSHNEDVSSGLVPLTVANLDASDIIGSDQAADLRWYFRVGGLSIFDRSTMSRMLERAELMFCHARACRKCGGDPARNIGGTGWMPSTKKRRKANETELKLLRWLKSRRQTLPPAGDTPCTKCKGRGWYEAARRKRRGPLTARPTGSSVPIGSASGVGDVGMQRLAIVSTRLSRMEVFWPLAEDILAAWYGPDEGGRLISLWPLTPAGKTLLRRNRLELDPLRFFENERADWDQRRDPQREELFNTADDQARELKDAASRLWNAFDATAVQASTPVEVSIDAP